jgi:hypothetical protein
VLLRFPLPWRAFTLDTPLSRDQVEAVVVRALRTESIRGFSTWADGFSFLQRLGGSLRSGWMLVTCRIQRIGPPSEATTSRLSVRMRGPIVGVVMLGASTLLLPVALVEAAMRGPSEPGLGGVLLFSLLGTVAWFVFSLEYDRGARALEKRLRSALQRSSG